jgi:signal transduction histidine kinase
VKPAALLRDQAARIAVTLVAGLALIQAGTLVVAGLDRLELARLGQARTIGNTVMSIYRTLLETAPEDQAQFIASLHPAHGMKVALSADPPGGYTLTPAPIARLLRADLALVALPPGERPRRFVMLGGFGQRVIVVGVHMDDGRWLNVLMPVPQPRPWNAPNFVPAFLLGAGLSALLAVWAVWRMARPIRVLSAAADRLGRDVNAPPLPQTGSTEMARAAAAFNLMAERIRRFVADRTFLLSAIGHDLRTPITRLKLRTEFIDDEDMRRRLLADVEELEAMVNATMAFGRDVASSEPVGAVDLAVLVRTVLDEASDARPEVSDQLAYEGPEHLTVQSRSLALKRAIANLVGNAINYGGGARVRLDPPAARDPMVPGSRSIRIVVEDDGPGIPPEELPRVFEPFHRAEASRNRETGGFGLGLPIARNILRAHGGDVTLANRPEGGAQATILLPV